MQWKVVISSALLLSYRTALGQEPVSVVTDASLTTAPATEEPVSVVTDASLTTAPATEAVTTTENEDLTTHWYEGSDVPDRYMPVTPGCAAVGKVYSPFPSTFTDVRGWDWCQSTCGINSVPQPDGSLKPCAHFTYFPDGKCFFFDDSATLSEDTTCTVEKPCEHGFRAISGPSDCKLTALWVDPNYVAPSTASTTPWIVHDSPSEVVTEAPTEVVTEAPTEAPTMEPTEAPRFVLTEPYVELRGGFDANLGPKQPENFCDDVPAKNAFTEALATASHVQFNAIELTCRLLPAQENTGRLLTGGASAIFGYVTKVAVADGDSALKVLQAWTPETLTEVVAHKLELAGLPSDVTVTALTAPVLVATATRDVPTMPAAPTMPAVPEGALIKGWLYYPQVMSGTANLQAGTLDDCYQLCKANPTCMHFGYLADSSCTQQDKDAVLTQLTAANCPEGIASCPDYISGTVSGPRDYEDKSLWPVVPVVVPVTVTDAPVEVTTSPVAPTEEVPMTMADMPMASISQSSGDKGGISTTTVVCVGMGLALLAGVCFFAFQGGWIDRFLHGESDSDEEAGSSQDDRAAKGRLKPRE